MRDTDTFLDIIAMSNVQTFVVDFKRCCASFRRPNREKQPDHVVAIFDSVFLLLRSKYLVCACFSIFMHLSSSSAASILNKILHFSQPFVVDLVSLSALESNFILFFAEPKKRNPTLSL